MKIDYLKTPVYIIEEKRLRHNLALIREVACRTDSQWILAFKAFALWKTFPIFREYISSTTASSLSEARLAFEEFGAKAHTYSPAYKDDEFDEIVSCSSHLTFNSLSQYERFHERAGECSLGLRVNPEYSEVETLLYNPCAPGTRFGVSADKLPAQLPSDIKGFHCHCHCESGSDVFERSLQHIEEKFAKWFPQLEWINFGGGHLVTRKDYDIERLVRHMPDCLEMPYFPEVRGASLSPKLGDDRGLKEGHCSDPQPPNLGGLYRYRLGGNSCLSGDWMGDWQFDHELKVGEQIIFEDMIHYTTVKTNTFNGITHPSIAMEHSDGTLEMLREYSYEDYRDRMD